LKEIVEVPERYQEYITNLKKEGYCILGYCRKSKTTANRGEVVKSLQDMIAGLQPEERKKFDEYAKQIFSRICLRHCQLQRQDADKQKRFEKEHDNRRVIRSTRYPMSCKMQL
jgi:hypothetical protein